MNPIATLGLTAITAIALFFALRGVMIWYFKINEVIELQKLQVRHLKRIADKLNSDSIKVATQKTDGIK